MKQSLSEWEAIVVDDGSEPEEWRKATEFYDPRVRFLQRIDGLKGPSRCRNLGLAISTGRYVMFVDSDDIVAPWCLAGRVEWIKARSEADYCVFPVMLFRKEPGDMAILWNRLEGENDLQRFLKSDPPWHTSSPLWRRAAIEQLGGFDEEIMYGDDADLHMRALFAGLPYSKARDDLPDVFIRRATNDRITNTLSDRLLDSRMTRLAKGTQLIKKCGTAGQQRQWEGQYFVEAEFLLFNVPNGHRRQTDVLRLWRDAWRPTINASLMAAIYFFVARLTRNHCYVLLRLMRRIAMKTLPNEYFPRGGFFESEAASPIVVESLNSLLIQAAGQGVP